MSDSYQSDLGIVSSASHNRRKSLMREKVNRLCTFVATPHRLERLRILSEMRFHDLHQRLFDSRPFDAIAFDAFINGAPAHGLAQLSTLLQPGREAEHAAQEVLADFQQRAAKERELPMPIAYLADRSAGMLCYALVRALKPARVLETGVAYGITSALVLLAMARNNYGELISIDLPPLSDPQGSCLGLAVPERLKNRWTVYIGSSRRLLRQILKEKGTIPFFVSDDACTYSLQRYELETVWPYIPPGGAVLFGTVTGARFQNLLQSVPSRYCCVIKQPRKPTCATGLLLK